MTQAPQILWPSPLTLQYVYVAPYTSEGCHVLGRPSSFNLKAPLHHPRMLAKMNPVHTLQEMAGRHFYDEGE